MSFRLKPQDITPATTAPFMTLHSARCTAALTDALASDELFLNVRSNLRAGDQVTLCRYSSGDWMKARVVEYATVIITESTVNVVEFHVKEPITIIPDARPELQVVKAEPELAELVVEPDEEKGGFLVKDAATGYVHKHFKIKAPAVKYINDYGRKARAEAA